MNWKYNFHANIEINKPTNDFISWIRYCKEIVDLTRIWHILLGNIGIPKKLDKYCDMFKDALSSKSLWKFQRFVISEKMPR